MITLPDTVEVAQAIREFFEYFALSVFVAVVAADVILHLTEGKSLTSGFGWPERLAQITIRDKELRFRLPAFHDSIDWRGLVKTLSLIGFGAAIALEIAALPYAERADQLSAEEISQARRQSVVSLVFAAAANKEAKIGAERAAGFELSAASLRKKAEDEAMKRAKLEAFVAGLRTSRHVQFNDASYALLSPYKGTRFTLAVYQDGESGELASDVFMHLQSCGWIYVPPPNNLITGYQFLPGTFGNANERVKTFVTSKTGVMAIALKSQWPAAVAVYHWFDTDNVALSLSLAYVPLFRLPDDQQPLQIVIGQKDVNGDLLLKANREADRKHGLDKTGSR